MNLNENNQEFDKDSFIDRHGNKKNHTSAYYRRVKQLQRRSIAAGVGAVVLIAAVGIFMIRGLIFGGSTVDAAEKTKNVEKVSSEPISIETDEGKIVKEEKEEEPEGPFFKGYEPYEDENTQTTDTTYVNSKYSVLVDLDTGHVEAERNADEVISPASMTKILTVLVAADHLKDESSLDDKVTISTNMTDYPYVNDCSTAGFQIGEEVTVRDLFYGTILPSGGDAAMGLAYYTTGTTDMADFVKLMNEKVEELGLSDTAHFQNPIGIYDENNHCTVKDMAMILKAAMENEFVQEVMSTHIYVTTKTPQHPDGLTISNLFLRRIEDKDSHGTVIAAKTGFVVQSRNCAASYGKSDDGKNYICVTGNAHSAWRAIYDHVAIYDQYTGTNKGTISPDVPLNTDY